MLVESFIGIATIRVWGYRNKKNIWERERELCNEERDKKKSVGYVNRVRERERELSNEGKWW